MADDVTEAQQRYTDALDACRRQRDQILEDIQFSDPSDPQQWDAKEKQQRESDPGGARPCLVFDQTEQYVANVAGQIEQSPPAIHAIPVGGGADRKVAEQLDGFFRHIEHTSRAQQHYMVGLTSAARAGVGYLLVYPETIDRALGYQEPRIGSEGDPLRIVFDPWSKELDGNDADCGWHLTPLSHKQFEAQFGKKAEKISFGEVEQRTADERESIYVAQQWIKTTEKRNVVIYLDESGMEQSEAVDEADWHQAAQESGLPLQFLRSYKDKQTVVKWSLMSGAQEFQSNVYPADGIGIVPIYGYVAFRDGRLTYCGIPRRARQPQMAYNYHMSEMRAYASQAPKSPMFVPVSALDDANMKALYDKAGVENRAYLPYQDWDAVNNRPIPPPHRNNPSVDLRNHIEGAMQARNDIQAALGMYQASLGAPSNETSGVAIEGRKQQGEAATAHFPSHLSASLAQVGKLVMQMIPKLIDKKRQVRILGIDNTPSNTVIDPKQENAVVEHEGGKSSINPGVGNYDVRVVVGPSYSTQRQQAQEAYTEMMRANPAMMPAIAPLWAQVLDVPHADKLAQVLTAMAPDPVKAILNPEQDVSVGQLKQELEQCKAALQEAIQHAQAAQQDADEASMKVMGVEADKEAKDDENAIKAYDAFTKRLQTLGATITPEMVQQIAMQTVQESMAQPNPLDAPSEEGAVEQQEGQMQQPQQPSPEIQALGESQQAIAGVIHDIATGQDQIAQGQQQMMEVMTALLKAAKATRVRIPHRDASGDIIKVTDKMDDETPSEDSTETQEE
jgi:hypothetical protein